MTRSLLCTAAAFLGTVAAAANLNAAAAYPKTTGTNNNVKPAEPVKQDPVVIRFQSAGKQRVGGTEVLVFSGTEASGRQNRQYAVENEAPEKGKPPAFKPKAAIMNMIKDAKPGDLLKIEAKLDPNNYLWAEKVETYTPVEHEDEPNVFVFDGAYKDIDNKQDVYKVEVTKFAKRFICFVQMAPVKEGKGMAPDETIIATAEAIDKSAKGKNKKPPVEATIVPQGQNFVITSLDMYQTPMKATFTKLADADIDGQKGQSVEIDQDGKTVTAMIPGKMLNKKWTTDPMLLAEAKRLKAGAAIVYKTRELDGKTYIRFLAPAPKDTVAKPTASTPMPPKEQTTTAVKKEPAKK